MNAFIFPYVLIYVSFVKIAVREQFLQNTGGFSYSALGKKQEIFFFFFKLWNKSWLANLMPGFTLC